MKASRLLNARRHRDHRDLSRTEKAARAKCLDLQLRIVALQEAIDLHRVQHDNPFRDLDLYQRASRIGL